jgi:hypothetical protein
MKMNILILFFIISTLFSGAQQSHKFNRVDSEKGNETIEEIKRKADRLRQIYKEAILGSPIKTTYERKFFDEFPSDFKTFFSLYGYDGVVDDLGSHGSKHHILTDESFEHVFLFNRIESIPNEEYYTKLINLSIGGYWQGDGVNYLNYGLRERVKTDHKLTCELLSKRTNKEIQSFWYFYFDGPHPSKDIPSDLQDIKRINSKIYSLMKKALTEVNKVRCEGH